LRFPLGAAILAPLRFAEPSFLIKGLLAGCKRKRLAAIATGERSIAHSA
jgi:hypothetical protein